MIANTCDVPHLAGGCIDVDAIKRPTSLMARRTKIVCTIGPACWEVPQLETLIDAGMSVARLDFSHHHHHDTYKACLDRLREAANNKAQNVAVMLDIKGPEIRLGYFANHNVKSICLVEGESVTLTTDYSFRGDATKLACSHPSLSQSVAPGQSILLADNGSLTVVSCHHHEHARGGEVICRIDHNVEIGERQKMNLPGVVLPTLAEDDTNDIVNFGIKYDVDFIAVSCVREGEDVRTIRQLLSDHGGQHIKIVCKLDNVQGLRNYKDILRWTDAIMIVRDDLSMDIPPEKVLLAQKYMIREANLAGKPVIVASQMLDSMTKSPYPTRVECSDIANSCYDGTDCVMLSDETSIGPHFREAVSVLVRICCEAESSINFNSLYLAVRNSTMVRYRCVSIAESIAFSAVKTANDIGAKIIVVLSESGAAARYVAKFRPGMPIAVLTPSKTVARQCFGILKGSYAFVVDSLEDTDALIAECTDELCEAGIANEGDPFVVVCGKTFGMGSTNQIKVEYVRSNYWDHVGESDMSAQKVGREAAHESHVLNAEQLKGCSIM